MSETLKKEEKMPDSVYDSAKVIDKSYLTDMFIPSSVEAGKLIAETISKFTLNKEQCHAFHIIANHASKLCRE